MSESMTKAQELVNLQIDGKNVSVPKGTNLIEAAKSIGVEIPFYCYHKHLSIAGNCRMCQVEVEGAPKLTIACNTAASEGMKVKTQETSEQVKEAQRATLEFLLINHPLDCTVCDQAGHCKLQDYYYDYNAKASRFIEEKSKKIKAEKLGEEVIYDGERCIVCTRCVRFCDEYTETGELSVLNRGDRTVIAVNEDRPLNNPFSGCTVDLCPVGALTHSRWRFNSRIWYTGSEDTICTGCSTGCNISVHVRDDKIIQVKGRLNSEVNQEWMCDEGRYGFDRFQPKERSKTPLIQKGNYLEESNLTSVIQSAKSFANTSESSPSDIAVFVSPFLTTEEIWLTSEFLKNTLKQSAPYQQAAIQLRTRKLTKLESKLISPDYAPNARSGNLFGFTGDLTDWRASLEAQYDRLLAQLRAGVIKRLILIGDQAILDSDLDQELTQSILAVPNSLALTPRGLVGGEIVLGDAPVGAHQLCKLIIPTQTVHEKNGVMLNKDFRLQRLKALISPPNGSYPEWLVLQRLARELGSSILPDNVTDERTLFLHMLSKLETSDMKFPSGGFKNDNPFKELSNSGSASLRVIGDNGFVL